MKVLSKYRYWVFFILSASLCVWLTVLSASYIIGNEKAIDLIVTMLSILSGLIIAVIVLIGDPIMLADNEWEDAELMLPVINSKLAKYQALFIIYIMTLIAIFASRILTGHVGEFTIDCINNSQVFLIYLSLCYSLLLPRTLITLLKSKQKEYISLLRKKVGLKK